MRDIAVFSMAMLIASPRLCIIEIRHHRYDANELIIHRDMPV